MRLALFLSVLALLFRAETSHADSPARPETYKKLAADGKFVFVMLVSEHLLKQELKRDEPEINAIHQTYAKSGLYKNDGSNEPLWTVDWYAHSVHVASDGVHLVRMGRWPFLPPGRQGRNARISEDDLKQEAVSFFANGKLLREYSIGELVDEPKLLPMSVSHFDWLTKASMIEDKNQFEITTVDGNRILFDLTNARILEKKKMGPDTKVEAQKAEPGNIRILAGPLTIAFAIIGGFFGYMIVSRRRQGVDKQIPDSQCSKPST